VEGAEGEGGEKALGESYKGARKFTIDNRRAERVQGIHPSSKGGPDKFGHKGEDQGEKGRIGYKQR